MYHKNLPRRVGFTPKFENGVKTFVEWDKCGRGHMDGDKIRCPYRKCKNTKDFFDADSPLPEEQTPTTHEEVACYTRRMMSIRNTASFVETIEVVFFKNNYGAHDVSCHTSNGGVLNVSSICSLNKKIPTKNHTEYKVAHPRLTGDQIRDWVADINPIVEMPLTLPSGYELRMHGMKSHDYYIFMHKLIPIVFSEMLSKHVKSASTKVSLLFQRICSTTLDVAKLRDLEHNITVIMCNLQKIFSPTFFGSIEHLNDHLSYEAHVGDQRNTCGCAPLKVERSIQTKHASKNNDLTSNKDGIRWSICNYPGRASGASKKRWLSGSGCHIIETYILTNCEVVTPYYE
ncbi:hypothetical protein Sango_0824500 [Sesamum angolense]|uniref:DUF4218 domain-containing protein n=1 Tax=Sesamum angolense TaxID=2727404 RepID=A0AAE1X3B3_9LAMI|nr:hypothetical protein Sango_0824500 [Sesamum angolense]